MYIYYTFQLLSMTESEIAGLSPTDLYYFNLYYGEKLLGHVERDNDGYYIVRRRPDNREKKAAEIGRWFLPAQVESYHIAKRENEKPKKDPDITYNSAIACRTLVVVGAGASYDYTFEQKAINKPPLAMELFDDRYAKTISNFNGAENLCPQILHAKDIEEYFQQQWNKIIQTYNPLLLNKIMDVQFYLHYLFRSISLSQLDFRKNNYTAFFQALEDDLIKKGELEKALVVSFNYDSILEKSITKSLGYRFDSLDDYVNTDNKLLLFKPHGSWDWIKKIDPAFCQSLHHSGQPTMASLHKHIYEKQVSLAKLSDNLAEETTVIDSNMWDNYYFPQLLIPYKQKDAFVMPEKHAILLNTFLTQVEKIIIIGWKGAEGQFKKMLSDALGHKSVKLTYVTAGDTTVEKEIKEVLQGAIISQFMPEEKSTGTFSELNRFIRQYPDRIFN